MQKPSKIMRIIKDNGLKDNEDGLYVNYYRTNVRKYADYFNPKLGQEVTLIAHSTQC